MIQKQYDQLLERCEQTKAEVADLSKDIDKNDFIRILEIEKTQALIASIEEDVQAKKQDVYETEIKNRYQELYSAYETTKKEVEILENLLQSTSLDKADYVRINQDHDLSLSELDSDEMFISTQLPVPKRERLNLRSSTPSLNLSRPLDSGDEVVEAKLENLENIALMLDKQTTETTHGLDPETNMEETTRPEQPIPAPIFPQIPEAPLLPPIVPEMSPPQLKTEIKEQSKSNEINQAKKQATKKKSPLSEKKGNSPLSIFFNVIFYFVLIFSIVFVMLFGNQNPKAIPRHVRGYSVMRVSTGSMEPNIPVNSLIVTRATNPNDLQIGDVVTYGRANNTTLTHRIYEIVEGHTPEGRAFILKGDALDDPDTEAAAGKDIIGRVIFISYPFGRALMFFQDQFWLVITLVVLILVILFVLQGKTKNLGKQPQKTPDLNPIEKK